MSTKLDFDVKKLFDVDFGYEITCALKWVWKNYLYLIISPSLGADANTLSVKLFYKVNLYTGKITKLFLPENIRNFYKKDMGQIFILDDKVYIVAGGNNNSNNNALYNTMYIYDLREDSWILTTTDLFFKTNIFKGIVPLVLVDRELYMIQGNSAYNSWSKNFYKFNLDTKELITLAPKAFSGSYPQLTYKDNKIYCYYSDSSASIPHYEYYDIKNNEWSSYFFTDVVNTAVTSYGFYSNIELRDKIIFTNPERTLLTPPHWTALYSTSEKTFSICNGYSNTADYEIQNFPNSIPSDVVNISNYQTHNNLMEFGGRIIFIGVRNGTTKRAILSIGNKVYRTGIVSYIEMTEKIDFDNDLLKFRVYGFVPEKTYMKFLISNDNGLNYYAYDGMWKKVEKENIIEEGNTIEELEKLNRIKILDLVKTSELKILVGMISYDPYSTPMINSVHLTRRI